MKKTPWLALAVCAILVVSGLMAGCQSKTVVLGKVGKVNITNKDVDMYANFILLSNGVSRDDITSQEDMKDLMTNALDAAVTYELLQQKATEQGLTPLSEADQKTVTDQVTGYTDQLKSNFKAEADAKAAKDKSVDPDKELQKMVDDKMKQDGLTVADLTNLLTRFKVADLLQQKANKDVAVTDADIQSKYDELAKQQKEDYDKDGAVYEDAKSAGDTIVYVPAGFRYVKHILITFSDEDSSAISTARSSGDNTSADKLRTDALAKIQSKADEVLGKVKAGEDFDKLMEQYGQDPGMQNEPEKTTGYEMGASTNFVTEFKDAAMKLAKVGDVTDLVATDFGYHIIKYVADVTPGPVALDSVKDALKTTLLTDKQGENWDKTVEQWKTDAKVESYPDKLNTALTPKGAAAASAAAAQATVAPQVTEPVPAAS